MSKHSFIGSGYSDDCGYLEGAYINKPNEFIDESQMCHAWYELLVDGKVVGRCQMRHEGGWEFVYEGDIEIKAGKLLERPDHWDPE